MGPHALQDRLDAVDVDRLAVAVVDRDGTTLRFRGSPGVPAPGAGDLFYGASLTKQLVGYLIAEQVLAGHLDAASPVAVVIPGTAALEDVTIDHLLRHTSAIPEVTAAPEAAQWDNAAVLAALRSAPPSAGRPGKRFAYSNTGYVVLAEVLARVTGVPLPALASTRIFERLGMDASRIGGPPVVLDGVPDPPPTVGDGGLWTSISDLARWLHALDAGPLDPAAVASMQRPSAHGYGWGVSVAPSPFGIRVTHGGTWSAWLSKSVRLPSRGVAVAVLSTGGTESGISDLGLTLADDAAGAAGSRR